MLLRTSMPRNWGCGLEKTNNVIELPLKRETTFKARDRSVQQGPRFTCLKCEGQKFVLLADGHVLCDTCNAQMRNLWCYHCREKA